MREIPSVVAVVMISGKVLLLKRHPYDRSFTGWCLPGGKVDAGETKMVALDRELTEETNFRLGRAYHIDDYVTEKGDRRYTISAYLVICKSPHPFKLNREELEAHSYEYPVDALKMDLAGPTTRKIMEWLGSVDLSAFMAETEVETL